MVSRLRTVLLSTLCALVLGALAFALAAPATPAEAEEADTGLGLVYLDRSEVGLGDVQSIAVLADGDAPELAGATLTVAKADGTAERILDAAKVVDGAALVELANDDASLAGDWKVASVTLRWADGSESTVALDDVDDLSFAFAPEALEAPGTTFTALDGDGELVTSDDLGDVAVTATDDAVSTLALAETQSTPSAYTLAHAVVALDPGHGGEDGGAHGLGFWEKEPNWKISMATKAWLEAHGVHVYVTHEQNETPNPSIYQRVQRAVNQGACVFISQHNNETPGGTGSEIYIPYASDYYPNVNEVGSSFASELAPKLQRLGLNYRGTKTRVIWDDPDYAYESGDAGDYYGITRYSREHGVTGILIEHAFVDTESDAALLRDDDFLRRLGEADAEAIYANLEAFYQAYVYNQQHPWVDPVRDKVQNAIAGSVFRLYNQWSGEHLFTTDKNEVNNLLGRSWTYEDVSWVDPREGASVYRLYNPHTEEHLYTTDVNEYKTLGAAGWHQEGVKLHSADATAKGAIAVYRLFNPYSDQHLFTTDKHEYDGNQAFGWRPEGVKLYGLDPATVQVDPNDTYEPETDPKPATYTPIMGQSATSQSALRSWFSRMMAANGKVYPEIYAEKGAATPEAYVDILWEEATAEGVRPDVLLGQVIHETGWLQFGGMVKPEDCNFGGIGATDSEQNRAIAEFPDVRTGLRAQVQHLRAYADPETSKAALAHDCVDPRFDLVSPKGKAPTVESLSGKWSSGSGYGASIVSLMESFPKDLA